MGALNGTLVEMWLSLGKRDVAHYWVRTGDAVHATCSPFIVQTDDNLYAQPDDFKCFRCLRAREMIPPTNAKRVFKNRAGVVVGWWAGPRVSDVEICKLARQRWSTPWKAVLMTAIALAESNGYSHSTGDVHLANDLYGPSYGLWQMRWLRAGLTTVRTLLTPEGNADAAADLQRAYTMRRWGSFKNGSYLLYLLRARQAHKDPASAPFARPTK